MEKAPEPAPPPAPASSPGISGPTNGVKRKLESGVGAGGALKVARTDRGLGAGVEAGVEAGAERVAAGAKPGGGGASVVSAVDARTGAAADAKLFAASGGKSGVKGEDVLAGLGKAAGEGAAGVRAAKAEPEMAAVEPVGREGKGRGERSVAVAGVGAGENEGGLRTSGAGKAGEGVGAAGADAGKGTVRFEEGTGMIEAGNGGQDGGGNAKEKAGDGGEWARLPEDDDADDDDEMEGEADLDLAGMRQHEAEQVAKFNAAQLQRYECYRRSDLKTAKVKKVLTALSPALVKASDQLVVAVKGLAKVFVGDVVETALEVRHEYGDTGPLQPKHLHEAYRRMELKGGIPSTSAGHNSLS